MAGILQQPALAAACVVARATSWPRVPGPLGGPVLVSLPTAAPCCSLVAPGATHLVEPPRAPLAYVGTVPARPAGARRGGRAAGVAALADEFAEPREVAEEVVQAREGGAWLVHVRGELLEVVK